MNIDVEWTSEQVFVGADKAPPGGYAPQWTVTARKKLGPHELEKSLTVQQLGTPPLVICRDYELRVCRQLEEEMLWNRKLAAEGMAESG